MEATTALTRSLSLSARPRTAAKAPRMPTLSVSIAPPRALPLRRARSDADLVRSARSPTAVVLLRSPRPRTIEEEAEAPLMDDDCFHGAGKGNGNSSGHGGGGRGGGGGGCQSGMGEYYRKVLRLDPHNPLLLRNYGKYLHEVERDLAGAEEYYGRALLACPGDADLLSLYGRVLWEAQQDKERAAGYFERAVQAAPDDCYVLGSYASFLWDADDEDDEEEVSAKEKASTAVAAGSPALVPAC